MVFVSFWDCLYQYLLHGDFFSGAGDTNIYSGPMTNLPLKRGDTIGVAASSSPFRRDLFLQGITTLESLGFRVTYQDDIFDADRYLAGSDERRAEELTQLFKNDAVRAILFARGGYGSQRVIPLLDASLLRKHLKPVVGFSDLTALLVWLRQMCHIPTFYGPVITQLGRTATGMTKESLLAALTKSAPLGALPSGEAKVVKPGVAEGKIVGGCLSLLTSSIGTPYELETENAILFLEEVNEKAYAVDRMLTQLKNAGKLASAKGIIFGSMVPHEDDDHSLSATIIDIFSDFPGPVIANFPSGHADFFVTLPLGVKTRLDAPKSESPVLSCLTTSFA